MMEFPNITNESVFALDTETTGPDWRKDDMFGFSLSLVSGEDFYWDIRKTPKALDWLKDSIKRLPRKTQIVNHNIGYDWHILRRRGINLPIDQLQCTMTRAALIDEHYFSYALDEVGEICIGRGKDNTIYQRLAEMFGGRPTRQSQMPNLHKAPYNLVAPYGKDDTRLALDLWMWQIEEIARQDLYSVVHLEENLMPCILRMETRGVPVDLERAEIAAQKLDKEVESILMELKDMAGFEVNPNPSKSIHKLINPKKNKDGEWEARDGTILPSTGKGAPSIGADQLEAMKDPAAKLILKARKYIKAKDTFIRSHILGHHINGVVYPNINQTKEDTGKGTGTGRFSYTDPALQQIPARDAEIASIVRPLFIPWPNHKWGCWDWKQFEFRMFAHYINDPTINRIYEENPEADFHGTVAEITGLPRDAERSGGVNAKQMNLGMVFGMGAGTLCENMGLPFTYDIADIDGVKRKFKKPGEQGEAIFSKYHNTIPGISKISKKAKSRAKARGYVHTIMGRHIRFPYGQFTHKAAGLIYQGSSADCIKQKIIEIDEYFNSSNIDASILLSVHDETNNSLPVDDKGKVDPKIIKDVTEILETFDGETCPIKLRIPIKTDFDVGDNWAQASGKGN